jgi:hypothetical protein
MTIRLATEKPSAYRWDNSEATYTADGIPTTVDAYLADAIAAGWKQVDFFGKPQIVCTNCATAPPRPPKTPWNR